MSSFLCCDTHVDDAEDKGPPSVEDGKVHTGDETGVVAQGTSVIVLVVGSDGGRDDSHDEGDEGQEAKGGGVATANVCSKVDHFCFKCCC